MPSYWELAASSVAAYAMPGQVDTAGDFANTADGVWVGTPAYTDGPHGRAFRFSGSNYVTAPVQMTGANAAFLARCQTDQWPPVDSTRSGAWALPVRPYQLASHHAWTNGRSYFNAFRGLDSRQEVIHGVNLAQPHRVAIVNDSTGSWTARVDGGLVTAAANTAPLDWTQGASFGYSEGLDGATNAYYMQGQMSELLLLDRVVTSTELNEYDAGPEPTVIAAGSVSLSGSTLSWSGWVWQSHYNGLVTEVFDLLRDGAVVATAVESNSIDLTLFGSGQYTVRARAANDGGTSPLSESLASNSVSFSAATFETRIRVAANLVAVPGFAATESKPAGEVVR